MHKNCDRNFATPKLDFIKTLTNSNISDEVSETKADIWIGRVVIYIAPM